MEEKKNNLIVVGELADGTTVFARENSNSGITGEVLQDALGRIITPKELQIVNMQRIVGMKSCIQYQESDKGNVVELVDGEQAKKGKPIIINRPPEQCSKVVIGLNQTENGLVLTHSYVGDEIIPEDDYSNPFWDTHAYVYDRSSVVNDTQKFRISDGKVLNKKEFEASFIFDKSKMKSERADTIMSNTNQTLLFVIGAPAVLSQTGARQKATEAVSRLHGIKISASDIKLNEFANVEEDVSQQINEKVVAQTIDSLSQGKFIVVESDFSEPYGKDSAKKITDEAKKRGYSLKAIIVNYMPDLMIKAINASPGRAEFIKSLCEQKNGSYRVLAEQLKADGVKVDVFEEESKSHSEGPDTPESPDLI